MSRFALVLLFAVTPLLSFSQNPEDHCRKMLEFISGEPGKERDWEEFRGYFTPTAQFYTRIAADDGAATVHHLTLEEFVRLAGPGYAAGFHEEEVRVTSHTFNGIATVWQHYKAILPDGTEEEGINTLQLVEQNGQWYITSLIWAAAEEGQAIPAGDFKK